MTLPLLLVDVDGVISLYASQGDCVPALVEGIPHLLSKQAATLLLRIAPQFECVWCTGWEDRAGDHLPHLLGLPKGWPHLTFTEPPDGAHWKLAAIDAYAGPDRALAWIDDDHDDRTDAWARTRPGETLLVRTDPKVGLTEPQAAQLERWGAARR
jgi:hypothetical protein